MAEKRKASAEELRVLRHLTKTTEYYYEIDSFSASLEPYYFWLVDFVGKRALQYEIEKIGEKMGASVVSQFFGEMSSRKSVLEKRGMEILGSVNIVVKSIINLLYDLREFDRRLDVYDDIKKGGESADAAEMTLRRVWMDEVDVRKGGASINAMTAQRGLEFVTLRDAFMMAKSTTQIDEMDLNDRVKRILKGRLEEYTKWRDQSEKELRQRRKIELAYLKSQVESLRLYALWAKPYLKAAQMLQFRDPNIKDPELIQAFDQNYIEIVIRGSKKMYLKEFIKFLGKKPTYVAPETLSPKEKEALKMAKVGPYVYSIIEITFQYRAKPALIQQTQAGGQYRQLGKLGIKFVGYVMTPSDYERLERAEEMEAMEFIEGITTESLEAMREDLEKYLGELETDKKKTEAKKQPLLDQLFGGFGGLGGGTGGGGLLSQGGPILGLMLDKGALERRARFVAIEENIRNMFDAYDVFKKAHRLLSVPYPPDYVSESRRASKPAR